MILGHPLFPGENSVDQIVEICKVLGSPNKEDLKNMVATPSDFKFPEVRPISFKRLFRENTPIEAIEIVQSFIK